MRTAGTGGTDRLEVGIVASDFLIGEHGAMAAKKKSKMSAEHKAALAEGRAQGQVVRSYLDALEAHKPKRGRKRTPESIKKRIDVLESEIATASLAKRVDLVQERRDLERELGRADDKADLQELEKEFVKVAKPYSERKGIEYGTWREIGVPAAVLKQAGISRAG